MGKGSPVSPTSTSVLYGDGFQEGSEKEGEVHYGSRTGRRGMERTGGGNDPASKRRDGVPDMKRGVGRGEPSPGSSNGGGVSRGD